MSHSRIKYLIYTLINIYLVRLSVVISRDLADGHRPHKRIFPAALSFTRLYHVLHRVVNYHSILLMVQTEFMIDV